jgi:GNAT superfamily N-acetyltransferase
VVRLVSWRPELRSDFERLNREWIERYFAVEEEDRRVFADPEGEIVGPGGQVFFLLDEGGVRGTCAVVRHEGETFELAKMAVDPAVRGLGYGDRLMEAAIAFARGGPRAAPDAGLQPPAGPRPDPLPQARLP